MYRKLYKCRNSNWYFLLLIMVTLWGCQPNLSKINFVYVPVLFHESSEMIDNKLSRKRIEYYLVENFTGGEEQKVLIDKFVNSNKFKGADSILYYGIVFYKKTSITNLETINKNPKVIGKLANQKDLLFEYLWTNGKLVAKNDYTSQAQEKGRGDVEVLDIPDSLK